MRELFFFLGRGEPTICGWTAQRELNVIPPQLSVRPFSTTSLTRHNDFGGFRKVIGGRSGAEAGEKRQGPSPSRPRSQQ